MRSHNWPQLYTNNNTKQNVVTCFIYLLKYYRQNASCVSFKFMLSYEELVGNYTDLSFTVSFKLYMFDSLKRTKLSHLLKNQITLVALNAFDLSFIAFLLCV